MTKECYQQAVGVIKSCSVKGVLFASGGKKGYDALWARDSMISFLGASLVQDQVNKSTFRKTFKQSLIALAKNQSRHGQMPNAVDTFSQRKPRVDYASIDSTLWYLIGYRLYQQRYGDKSLDRKYKTTLKKALDWLECQDVGEEGTPEQLPTTDWQDAFPHKYGRTISTQALYYKVLISLGKNSSARKLKNVVDADKDKKLWNGKFYAAYRWKNHGKYKEMGEWFDSLGNLLAIVFGLADEKKAKKIISYLEKKKIHRPYPVKSIYPPIKKNSKDWQDYFLDCDARQENHYLNGGIWTFIGGFYILSLIKMKQFKKAEKELSKLAEANLQGNFPEWINPITRESHGKLQAWDAGTYLLAYESLKKKKVLV